MPRPSPWPILVVLLLGIVFLRERRLQQSEDIFLRWLLHNSEPRGETVPLSVVEIAADSALSKTGEPEEQDPASKGRGINLSPLDFALFLQSILEFQPTVVAFENVLRWRERDKNQEQVFIDQAMRVPRLLLASELTPTPDLDVPGPDVAGLVQVTGRRGDLIEYSGFARQPSEELRLISSAGYVNLPDEVADDIHVPLLFRYRGEVIPSFALEAILLWQRITPADVKVDLDSAISLPKGITIPIRSDGTLLISPNAAKKARRLSLNELLVGVQQRDAGKKTAAHLEAMRDQIVLARVPANTLSPPDIFAATIATIQSGRYVHRISRIFDFALLVILGLLAGPVSRFARIDIILAAIACTAGYCLIALALMSRWLIWLPGVLPFAMLWGLVVISFFFKRTKPERLAEPMIIPPPIV